MKHETFIIADLLQDLFSFYKNTLGTGAVYESYSPGSSEKTEVILLKIPHRPAWANPALGIKTVGYGNVVVTLFGVAPDEGLHVELSGKVLTLHSSCNEQNILWTAPDGSLGGMSRVRIFRKEDEGVVLFTNTLIDKLTELFYSGKYNTAPIILKEEVVL